MALSTERISEYYALNCANTEPARVIVHAMLVESLGSQLRDIYEHIRDTGSATSREVAEQLGIHLSNASTALGRLRDYGLLMATPTSGEDGPYYVYSLRERDDDINC